MNHSVVEHGALRRVAPRAAAQLAGSWFLWHKVMKTNVSRSTLTAAYAVAICADLIQICLFPLSSEGFLDPLDDISDVVVCLILSRLIGFHIAFLPSFLIKVIPGVTIAPTWTVAVIIATRNLRESIVDVPSEVRPDVVVNEEQPPKILPDK